MSRTQTRASKDDLETEFSEAADAGRTGSDPSWGHSSLVATSNQAIGRMVESHPPAHGAVGSPLPSDLQVWANQAFGADLSAVRVHTGSQAEQANREAGTSAYTVGSDIVLSSDHFPVLVHELAHTVQQQRGADLPRRNASSGIAWAQEGLADRAVEGALTGHHSVDVGAGAAVGFAGADKDEEANLSLRLMKHVQSRMIDMLMGPLGTSATIAKLLAPVIQGFVEELVAQLWTQRQGAKFLNRMLSMGVSGFGQLAKGYYIGLVEGLASPITDLFRLGVLMEKLKGLGEQLALQILIKIFTNHSALAADLAKVTGKVGEIKDQLAAAWINAKNNPVETIVGILDAQEHLGDFAREQAHDLGRAGASALVASFTSPFEPKKEQAPEAAPSLATPLALVESKVESLEAAVIDTPWAQVGNKLGYAVGFIAVQLALFIFTEGIGNAIEQVAAWVSKVGAAVGKLASGVGLAIEKMAEVAGAVGKAIAAVEHVVGALLGKALKPLDKIFGGMFASLGDMMFALRQFLQDLFGVSKKAATPLVEAAASKAGGLAEDLSRVAPTPTAPKPKIGTASSSAESLGTKGTEALEHVPAAGAPKLTEPPTAGQAAAPEAVGKLPESAAAVPQGMEAKQAAVPPGREAKPAAVPPGMEAKPAAVSPGMEAKPAATAPVTEPGGAVGAPATEPTPAAAGPAPASEPVPPAAAQPQKATKPPSAATPPKQSGAPKKPAQSKPKVFKPKKMPSTGSTELDEAITRIQAEVPEGLDQEVKKGVAAIRRLAKKDPVRAKGLADEIEAFLERRRISPDTPLDQDTLDTLSMKRDPEIDEKAIADELSPANVAKQKSAETATARRQQAAAGSPPPSGIRPFEERVHFGELDELERPTGVIGEVHPSDLHTGTETGSFYPAPLGKGELDPLGARRGHLLGNLFGGPGEDPRNIGWMFKRINNSQFKTEFENILRAALESGETVAFGVRPLYKGSELAPYAVEVWLQGPKTMLPPKTILTPGLSDL